MANYTAKLDHDLKLYRDLVQSGITPTAAYRRIYAATKKISDQAAYAGGLRKMRQLNGLNPLQAVTQPLTQPVKKTISQPIDDKDITIAKKDLLKRLWKTVSDGANSEATAAVKQLMEYLEKEEEKAEQKALDPAQLCAHLARFARNKPPPDYLPHVISALNMLLHPSRDEWIAALKIGQDRAETTLTPHQEPVTAPLPTQTPVNTDNNGGSPALSQ